MGILICVAISFAVLTPRLRALSLSRSYSSPVDFISDRYHSENLRLLISLCLVISNMIYIAGQFSAIADLVETITQSQIPGYAGAIFMGVVILALEFLGGLKSVMLTDTLQAVIMIFSFIIVPLLLTSMYGSFSNLLLAKECSQTIDGQCGLNQQADVYKVYPTLEQAFAMGSNMFGFLAYAILPQCVHRIYTAQDVNDLRVTFALLPFSGYLTMISGLFLGIVCAARLNEEEDDTAFGIVSGELYDRGGFHQVMGSLMMCAGLAAISSTADSSIIALSHIAAENMYKGKYFPQASHYETVLFSKLVSLLAVIVSICVIFIPEFNVSKASQIQSGIQIQALPAFFFGLFPEIMNKTPSSRSLIYAFLVSIIVLFLVEFGIKGQDIDIYLEPGIWGFLCQLATIQAIEMLCQHDYLNDDVRTYDLPPSGVIVNFPQDNGVALHSTEPFGSTSKKITFLIMLLLMFGGLPWYEDPDKATSFSGGWPDWAITYVATNSIATLCLAYLMFLWKPGKEDNLDGNLSKNRKTSGSSSASNPMVRMSSDDGIEVRVSNVGQDL